VITGKPFFSPHMAQKCFRSFLVDFVFVVRFCKNSKWTDLQLVEKFVGHWSRAHLLARANKFLIGELQI